MYSIIPEWLRPCLVVASYSELYEEGAVCFVNMVS